SVRRTFQFSASDLRYPNLDSTDEHSDEHEPLNFELGVLRAEYFRIPGTRLSIPQSVFIHESLSPNLKHFIAPRGVSIFRQIAKLSKSDIYIGGSGNSAIPITAFEQLVASMPTDGELLKYVSARVAAVIRNYMDDVSDAENAYKRYRNRRDLVNLPASHLSIEFREYDIDRFSVIKKRLLTMLAEEDQYSENEWQARIVDILLLINPKYVKAFKEAPILDSRTSKKRRVDFLLMDADGNVDALEIKKPFGNAIITKATYRDNHVPLRELSGSVIQVEKYLYHLVRSGEKGVQLLNKKYGKNVPPGIKLKVTNPSGLVLIGRDQNLTPEQRLDFEIVRRHYKNVVDIITYDDLLRRLQNSLAVLEQGSAVNS
ncbi:MAG: DUF4263 domain-containing protein, partial [Rhodopirellula sp.]|nr:DUF4263 domain-containing protein [Rhodopirellula sp.]